MPIDTSVSDVSPVFSHAAIVGVGLIGGSIGHGLAHHGVCKKVVAYDLNQAHARRALERRLVDEVALTLEDAVRDADVIILAVPVGHTARLLEQLAIYALPTAVIVDTGSVKQVFVRQCADFLPDSMQGHAVPCHPIAGHVSSGPEHADRTLMAGRSMVITPMPGTNPLTLIRVVNMWRRIGFQILTMSPQEHDAIYADLSHMPHVLAFALMQHVRERGMDAATLGRFAGNAFKDMTLHAGVDPRMWHDIFYHNRDEICRALSEFRQRLDELEHVITNEDQAGLQRLLAQLQGARLEAWPGSIANR